MKKSLLLFPLISILLLSAGCGGNSNTSNRRKRPQSSSSIPSTSETTMASTSESESEPEETSSISTSIVGPRKAEEVEEGENHLLPWNIDYDNFADANNSTSYFAYNKTYDFSGTNVYGYGMRAVKEIGVIVGGELVQFKGFKIIHLSKMGHETWIDGGQLQISKLQPTKLTIDIVSYGSYAYNPNRTISVYLGNKLITAPKDIETSVSPVREEFAVQTLVFDINAAEPSKITLQNRNSFSMYLQSIRFE